MSNRSILERNVLVSVRSVASCEEDADLMEELFLQLSRQPNASYKLYKEEEICRSLGFMLSLVDISAQSFNKQMASLGKDLQIDGEKVDSLKAFLKDRLFNGFDNLSTVKSVN